MPVVSFSQENLCSNIFIFFEKNILVRETKPESDELLTKENLPEKNLLKKLIDDKLVEDCFSEKEKNYSAAFLKEEISLEKGYCFIPLRNFFWRTKNLSEKNKALPSLLGELSARAHGFLSLRKNYKFCPSCGSSLIDDEHFTAKQCTSCGRLLFPRIEPAVIVLVSKGDEVLLVKSKTNKSGFFSCVAGFVEHGETIEQTAMREVFEETGISIKNLKYVGSQAWPFPDQLMLAFTADYESGEIKIQEEEIEAASWFRRDALPETPHPGSVAYNLIKGLFR